MTFLAPWVFPWGAAAAAAIVALHLLTTRRPPTAALPTARFVPEADLRAVARAARPADLLLLALRLLAVLAVTLAFAQVVFDKPGPSQRAVVALEWTTAVADPEAARATARAALGESGALVLFDTAARRVAPEVLDTLSRPTVRRAAWSPMFWLAAEAAHSIARGADSIQLVVVGTARRDAFDVASRNIRSAWPGRVDFRELAARRDSSGAARAELRTPLDDDALAPALRGWDARRGTHPLRVRRGAPTAADTAWARSTPNAVLAHWPLADDAEPAADGAVAFGERAAPIVSPLVRLDVAPGHAVARWRDGDVAATELAIGEGCVKSVGVGIPSAGDLTLRAPFADFLDALLAPCGGYVGAALPDSTLDWLRGPERLASARQMLQGSTEESPVTPWLLVLAAAALVAEHLLRRRPERAS